MKKRILPLMLALALALSLPGALAADARIEELEYMGFGVLKMEFSRDCSWYNDGSFALNDATDAPVHMDILAGDEEEAWLYAPELADGADYSLLFTLGGATQELRFEALTGVEYKTDKHGDVYVREDDERCDRCDQRGHDEDFCPERIDPANIPSDLRDVARFFDIDDFCDRCGGIGHDDDNCREG